MANRLPLTDIQFISDFAAFCRTKGDEEYYWDRPSSCALAQFGYPSVISWEPAGIPEAAYKAAVNDTPDGPDRFSALADRLEALLVDAPVVERG